MLLEKPLPRIQPLTGIIKGKTEAVENGLRFWFTIYAPAGRKIED